MNLKGFRQPKKGLWRIDFAQFQSLVPDTPRLSIPWKAIGLALVGAVVGRLLHIDWSALSFPLFGMAILPYYQANEAAIGANHPTWTDSINRPLREFLRNAGLNPDSTNISVPSFSQTVNAGSNAFSGTKEARITAAVALAVSLGWTMVYIPIKAWDGLSMLPYNASLVTFNAAVQMFAENGAGSFDPVAYGSTKNVFGNEATVDSSASIIAADAGATNGEAVQFSRNRYLVAAKISKSGFSDWQGIPGVNPSNRTQKYGTVIVAGYNGTLVEMPSSGGGSDFQSYGGIHGVSFYSPGIVTYPSAAAISSLGNVRQIVVENALIDGFNQGIVGPWGELYLDRLFIMNGKYGVFSNGSSDSWWSHVHAGSGLGAAAGASGGAGFFLDASNNITMDQCRGQVQKGGSGFDMRGSTRLILNQCIADSSELPGIIMVNCNRVELDGCNIFENGTTGAKSKGVAIGALSDTFTANAGTDEITITGGNASLYWTGGGQSIVEFSSTVTLPAPLVAATEYYLISSGSNFKVASSFKNAQTGIAIDLTDAGTGTHSILGVTRDIRIVGGSIFDRNKGTVDEKQDTGIQIFKTQLNGAASPKIRNIVLDGVDLSRVTTPMQYTNHVDTELRIIGCPGIRGDLLGASSDATYRVGEQAPNVLFNNAFGAAVNITFSQDGAYSGATFDVARGVGATGAFNLVLKNSAGTTLTTIAADATNVQMARVVYYAGAVNEWTLLKTAGF